MNLSNITFAKERRSPVASSVAVLSVNVDAVAGRIMVGQRRDKLLSVRRHHESPINALPGEFASTFLLTSQLPGWATTGHHLEMSARK